jgi:hypothetical protein
MKIRAEGWSRKVHGWQGIADINLAKTSKKRYPISSGETYVAGHDEDEKTIEGNLTISGHSNLLALSGHFEIAVEFSEADLARLLELFFKDRSANDVWTSLPSPRPV